MPLTRFNSVFKALAMHATWGLLITSPSYLLMLNPASLSITKQQRLPSEHVSSKLNCSRSSFSKP
ncbi:MAG: hypothetical protein DRO09_00750 [Thermoprotei archaeon]|nr:MAG: hypothetical protein DRO09_00750 [Thermoprotei archaeon]